MNNKLVSETEKTIEMENASQNESTSSNTKNTNIIYKTNRIVKNTNLIFYITFALAIIFILSPLILRIPLIKNLVDMFFDPLIYSDYKSSFLETIGSILGTVLAITGTLLLQKKIDEKSEEEKRVKENNDIRFSIIVIYYDLKLALKDISTMHKIAWISACTSEKDSFKSFYECARTINLYIDDNWIRNVASLHHVLDEDFLEDIFLLYGEISSIKSTLESNIYDEKKTLMACNLICKYYSLYNLGSDSPVLNNTYKEMLDKLKSIGKIEEKSNSVS